MADRDDISRFRFGPYLLDIASRQLLRDGRPVSVEPRVFDLLAFLARNADRAVDKDELQDAVWPGRVITETALTRAVMKARKAVGDDANRQAVIKTVHGHGYHFVADLAPERTPPAPAPAGVPTPADPGGVAVASRRRGRAWPVLAVAGALAVAALSWWLLRPPGETAQPEPAVERTAAPARLDQRSIAVLPFANRSDLAQDRYFADGMQDDLLTKLAKIGSLKVISRTSVMRYRDSELSVPEIARELGVASILEGGIQRSGDQVRVNVQLIDARTDEHLWAETYDRELNADNLFAIQSEITHRVVESLQGALSEHDLGRLDGRPTDSLEAYGEFVLGREALAARTQASLDRAQAHFEKAIALDPEYALAYVGLADTLNLRAAYGTASPVELEARRQQLIDEALALDPISGEAWTSLAALRVDQARPGEAEGFFRKAIEFSPNYSTAHHWYAYLLENTGRSEEALPVIRRALELDPNAPILTVQYARILWNLGEVEAANAALLEGVRRNPAFPSFYTSMATNLRELGRLGESMRWIQAGLALDETQFPLRVMECKRHLDFDDGATAQACLDRLAEAFPEASRGSRIELYQYRAQFPEALEEARQLADRFPLPFARIILGWNLVANGRYDDLLALVRTHWPRVLEASPPPIENTEHLDAAVLAGYALYATGETARANPLLDRALAFMQDHPRLRGEGYEEMDVIVHVLRGDRARAVDALREAVEAGWRDNWWRLRYPLYDTMRGDPQWAALVAELEADAAREREWFEAHGDEPLF